MAMGVVDGNHIEAQGLGTEGAGVIEQVGPEVKDFKIGDRVAVAATSSFATTAITNSRLCVKMADSLTFEEAATMPSVYCTVIRSLLEIARIERDQVRLP